MITKYDLRRYRHQKANIAELKAEIEELELTMIAPRVPALTGLPGSRGEQDKIGNVVAKVEKLRSLYISRVEAMLQDQERIEEAVATLDDREQRLIRLYYFTGITWEEVAVHLNCSWTLVHRLHRRALAKLGAENE